MDKLFIENDKLLEKYTDIQNKEIDCKPKTLLKTKLRSRGYKFSR